MIMINGFGGTEDNGDLKIIVINIDVSIFYSL